MPTYDVAVQVNVPSDRAQRHPFGEQGVDGGVISAGALGHEAAGVRGAVVSSSGSGRQSRWTVTTS
ncbi:hypothetical protein ACIRLA_41050 [Streptomyces sp. NPDC102364]|uniref:hypothetical protein n=1 Tax=Streptomyces sp. NPDC102364 TaxID=3366161 RepID=UPI0037FB53D2